ncbi:MAG: class I tRNA ligase family protein [bacterium]|nr:class I tRNA ligase family protein [bacterium]
MLKHLESFSLPKIEEEVLKFWKLNGIFQKSIAQRPAKKTFVFYEGPPTANARPGIHHVIARSFKDVICRYKTMRGFRVPRKGGWDTHGLPVELEVEKQLGLKSKRDIETYGVEKFNEACRTSVWKYKDEWERLTERMGFWLDMEHPYVTYDATYMESLWWILKEIHRKKLLFEGRKVVPWCPRCGTVLSTHELAQGYKEVNDESVYVKFKLEKGQKIGNFTTDDRTYILSWTTTPWTLPGNVALAVKPAVEYVIAEHENGKEKVILAQEIHERWTMPGVPSANPNLVQHKFKDNPYHKVLSTFIGSYLEGLRYHPLFDVKPLQTEAAYQVYPAGFVTTTDGTGVVHTAVMYGEDDYQLGVKVGLPQHHTVDEQARFTKDVAEFAGRTVKHKDPVIEKETTEAIIAALEKQGSLLKRETIAHEYPFCWRCSTPLIYYARTSWFIRMSSLREKLIAANQTINWVPAHLKDGRFGEWLREVKDWAISRARYWGTPLPVWRCEQCAHTEVLGSIAEVSAKLPKSTNRYILVRHGEAESNLERLLDCLPIQKGYHLTLKGRSDVEATALKLAKEGVDAVYASPLQRTQETATLIATAAGITKVITDERLQELRCGILNGRSADEHVLLCKNAPDGFAVAPEGGESRNDVRRRMYDFITEVDRMHQNKTIVVVSHGDPLWMLEAAMHGWTNTEAQEAADSGSYPMKGKAREVEPIPLPRNRFGELDLHRPYIDEVTYPCAKCRASRDPAKRDGTMHRIPDVVDVWFDSGAMPFAQAHYPFGNRQPTTDNQQRVRDKRQETSIQKLPYPADYISEAIDQTRGWFYTLLAVATLLGKKAPFKNVISMGHVLDKNGQKMSKSKGNTVDPWVAADAHGMDAIRWYFFIVNPPGEPKRFDERDLATASRELFGILYNSFVFFATYGNNRQQTNKQMVHPEQKRGTTNKQPKATHVLDRWVLARLDETIAAATGALEAYDPGGAARVVGEFVGDLSRWFIRRSRRRLQHPDSDLDHQEASAVLGYALVTTARLLAPFTPFFAEALYRSLVSGKADRSVHLADWPTANKRQTTNGSTSSPSLREPEGSSEPRTARAKPRDNKQLITDMAEVRRLASAGLAARSTAGIKVRQVLSRLTAKGRTLQGKAELLELLKDEVNVKEIVFDPNISEPVVLDTVITHELKEEGWRREFVRAVQELRQDAKLSPRDPIALAVEVPEELRFILTRDTKLVCREVRASALTFGVPRRFDAEAATTLDGMPVRLWLAK